MFFDPRPKPVPEPLELDEVLGFIRLLLAVTRGLDEASRQAEATIGLSDLHWVVLRFVGRHPGVSAGRLATMLQSRPSTLTGILSHLVDRGAIARTSDPTDGRRALFSLTPHGRKLGALRPGATEAKIGRALGGSRRKDVAATRVLLAMVAEALTASRG